MVAGRSPSGSARTRAIQSTSDLRGALLTHASKARNICHPDDRRVGDEHARPPVLLVPSVFRQGCRIHDGGSAGGTALLPDGHTLIRKPSARPTAPSRPT